MWWRPGPFAPPPEILTKGNLESRGCMSSGGFSGEKACAADTKK